MCYLLSIYFHMHFTSFYVLQAFCSNLAARLWLKVLVGSQYFLRFSQNIKINLKVAK